MTSAKDAYKAFLNTKEGADAYNAFKDILYSPSDSLAQKINQKIIRELVSNRENSIRICDIGGGDGRRMTHILSFLARENSYHDLKFQLDVVEQSKFFCEEFENRVSKSKIHNTEVHIYHGLFEDLFGKLRENESLYDIVFLIHSIFALKDEQTFRNINSLVKPGGKIVFISNARDSLLAKLKRILDKEYEEKRTEIDDVKGVLENLHVEFSSVTFNTEFSISSDDIDRDSYKILNWLSLGKYANASIEEADRLKVELKSLARLEDGLYYFSEQEEILFIPPWKELG